MKIAIVGGGTAGLIAALILKTKFNQYQVDIIASKQIGAIGVGEGSTEHWREFMHFVGIEQFDMIKNCDAVLKYGIEFKGWNTNTYYHSIQSPYNVKYGQYRALYGKVIGEGRGELVSPAINNGLMDSQSLGNNLYPANQYHFNTFKLGDYLTKICLEKNIQVFDDIINDVVLDENGRIKVIKSQEKEYQYDFYIDCTGFKRILIDKLGAKWKSYSNYLKQNAAIVFPTEEQDHIPLMTLSQAMDYGWLFRSPVWGRFGNGYIFDQNHTDEDNAINEVSKYYGRKIVPAKCITFDPGALDKTWIKNCVAIGLTSNFVEPLEASSIGATIHQCFLLTHRLENYNEKIIDSYNKSVQDIFQNIRDFVVLHYVTKKENTEFWKECASIKLPDSLKDRLDIWKHKLPIQEDFSDLSDYILYNEQNFIMIMNGLDLFDRESIRKEYESCSSVMKEEVNNIILNRQYNEQNTKYMPHKEFINTIREMTQ